MNFLDVDVGATTVKTAAVDGQGNLIYTSYIRHFDRVKEAVLSELNLIKDRFGGSFAVSITCGTANAELSSVGERIESIDGIIEKLNTSTHGNPVYADMDIYAYKQVRLLQSVKGCGGKYKVGLPLQLSMYEQLPLWAGFFETLGYKVVLPDVKRRRTAASGAACYPAKLIHGHIESLLDDGVDFIFMPCEGFNLDEHCSVNGCNCPVVAYYPELLKAINDRLTDNNFIMPYIDLNAKKPTVKKLFEIFKNRFTKRDIENALDEGLARLKKYRADVRAKADEIFRKAETQGTQVIVLAGRPYYSDAEVNRGINKLLTSLGFAVLSEDSVCENGELNANARLYRAVKFVLKHKNVNLVHLVSCGCKLDEITAAELRSVLENGGKLYTQIKLDELKYDIN